MPCLCRLLTIIFIILFSTNTHADIPAEAQFYVLVNGANNSAMDEKNVHVLLRRIYLKQQTAWSSGKKSYFFARKDANSAELAFRKIVLGMSDSELDKYWLRMKQVRGLTPPRAVGSTRILLRQLQIRGGAVGVVSEEDYHKYVENNPHVQVLTTFMVPHND